MITESIIKAKKSSKSFSTQSLKSKQPCVIFKELLSPTYLASEEVYIENIIWENSVSVMTHQGPDSAKPLSMFLTLSICSSPSDFRGTIHVLNIKYLFRVGITQVLKIKHLLKYFAGLGPQCWALEGQSLNVAEGSVGFFVFLF